MRCKPTSARRLGFVPRNSMGNLICEAALWPVAPFTSLSALICRRRVLRRGVRRPTNMLRGSPGYLQSSAGRMVVSHAAHGECGGNTATQILAWRCGHSLSWPIEAAHHNPVRMATADAFVTPRPARAETIAPSCFLSEPGDTSCCVFLPAAAQLPAPLGTTQACRARALWRQR